jgi:ABC-type multidrug transport system ATPase subunit
MYIGWDNISYELRDGIFGAKKSVLTNISGYVKEGELLALMGPSGMLQCWR